MENQGIKMLRLGLDAQEKKEYEASKIELNKKMSRLFSEARKNAKQETCYICHKQCSSFCNSHSVPQFCLKQISANGKVYFSGMQGAVPFMGTDSGIKEAGTFQIICRECDSTLFQDYENADAYDALPTGKMLAEIAMKNYLQLISKRLHEKNLYNLTSKKYAERSSFLRDQQKIISLDLDQYTKACERAKVASLKNHDDWYHLCYYKKLDYVVPLAMQSAVTLICDFEDNILNNIYNMSSDYNPKDIHIAIFPLKKASVILLFVDSREKKYRKFYRQLNMLTSDDQLAAINYIVHSYCENIFLSKGIEKNILEDSNFLDVCQKSSVAASSRLFDNPIQAAVQEFSLNNRHKIPNLLSKQYALSDQENI